MQINKRRQYMYEIDYGLVCACKLINLSVINNIYIG